MVNKTSVYNVHQFPSDSKKIHMFNNAEDHQDKILSKKKGKNMNHYA